MPAAVRGIAVARTATADERWTLGLMLLPVLLLAVALAGGKAIRPQLESLSMPVVWAPNWAALWPPPPAAVRPPVDIAYRPAKPVLTPSPVTLRHALFQPKLAPSIGTAAPVPPHPVSYAPGLAGSAFPSAVPPVEPRYRPSAPADLAWVPRLAGTRRYATPVPPDLTGIPAAITSRNAASPALPQHPPLVTEPTVIAALAPLNGRALADPGLPPPGVPDIMEPGWPLPPPPPIDIPGSATRGHDGPTGVCRPARLASLSRADRPADPAPRVALDASGFGYALADAAEAQTREFGFYTAAYQRIAFPRGDVAPMHGACSDVIVRAYRSLGIDLQEQVQRARVGSGDSNIDHRRTETLRKLFERLGAALPVTDHPEDYHPGDIVTYYRPHSRVSRAHIAVVSKHVTATGRPLIIHNRGWGAQIEDALFADKITGHYRLSGMAFPPEASPVLLAGRKRPAVARLASGRRRATQ